MKRDRDLMQKATFFFLTAPAAFGFAAFLSAGCTGTPIPSGAGAHASTSSATSAPSTSTTPPSATPDSGTGGAPPTPSPFATAATITVGDPTGPTAATLPGPATPDYYRFTGKAGDRLLLATFAQSLATPDVRDPSITDTVVTLFDADQHPIAQNDDAWPGTTSDSQLFVMLPANGDYYVTVGDCNSVFKSGCNPATSITKFNYKLAIAYVDKIDINAGPAQDGTKANAVSIVYKLPKGAKAGAYGDSLLDGLLRSTTDTHVFSFTPPLDTAVDPAGRPRAEFWLQPMGPQNGDGSTANVKLWVTDATGTTVLAALNQTRFSDADSAPNGPMDLSVPVTLGQPYFLFIQNAATTSKPATDSYFAQHFVGTAWYGLKEAEGVTATGENDDASTAERLTTPSGATAGSFFTDGNLPTGDVDWFEIDPPAGATRADVVCEVARAGSGLVGFQLQLFGADGTTSLGAVGPEPAAPKQGFGTTAPMALTGSPAKLLLRLTAASQDAMNTGTYYRCSISAR